MKEPLDSLAQRLQSMRLQFDTSFAQPLAVTDVPRQKLLAIQAGEGRFALPLTACASIQACPKVVALPAAPPGLLGIAGVRGRLLAVYRLAALLGANHQAAPPRWLLVARADEQVGFAVENIDAYLQVFSTEIFPISLRAELQNPFCGELLIHQGSARPLLQLDALVAAVNRSAPASPSAKEP